jgi:hypothetical protein
MKKILGVFRHPPACGGKLVDSGGLSVEPPRMKKILGVFENQPAFVEKLED